MSLNESLVEDTALGCFQVVSFAILLAPGESAAELKSFNNLELES